MPKQTLYNFWFPPNQPPAILIAGDKEIHSLFVQVFQDWNVQSFTWPVYQDEYDYGFYVYDATEEHRETFEAWLDNYNSISLVQLENKSFNAGYALSHHSGTIRRLVRKAKPYGDEIATEQTKEAAIKLVEAMSKYLSRLQKSDYLVAIPNLKKPFDLPAFIADKLCEKTGTPNGAKYVMQVREKQHSQKDLESVEAKRENVNGLFGTTENHPFSGKVVTIIDDIYRSGTTIEALAKVLREAGAKTVQALVLTKTFRD